MSIQIGKTYLVNHIRKGTFIGRLDKVCDVWATLTVTEGETQAMLPENRRIAGESVTVRLSFCSFSLQESTELKS